MIKHLVFRVIRYRVKSYLPLISAKFYKKIFTLSYKFFVYLKPSQLWIIVLALLNKKDLKGLLSIPSMFLLFNTILSDTQEPNLDSKVLQARLEVNKFLSSENDWERFFWVLIALAIIKRFILNIFRLLWIPFKIALIYYTLKYLGFDFNYAFNVMNNLSLGVIEWFHSKIIKFFELFNNSKNDKNS